MKASINFLEELENLFMMYEKEVASRKNEGFLSENTEKTYLLHSGNFVKWCKGNFEPGLRNYKNKI